MVHELMIEEVMEACVLECPTLGHPSIRLGLG